MEREASLEIKDKVDLELEASLDGVVPRLPKGIRRHIRLLKASGERERAEKVRQEALEKKQPYSKTDRAKMLLHDAIDSMLRAEESSVSIEQQVRAIWLLNAADMVSSDERTENLIRIAEASDNQHLHSDIDGVLVSARNELESYIPKLKG